MRQLTIVCLVLLAGTGLARPLADYVDEAKRLIEDDPAAAAAVMEQAVAEYPDSSTAHAWLGGCTGFRASKATDYAEAGRFATESFTRLDKAVELDAADLDARYFRGLMGVSVPEFMGRLETGMADLEIVAERADGLSEDRLVSTWSLLGVGHQKLEQWEKARDAWQRVAELAPGTEAAERAEEHLGLIVEKLAGPAEGELPSDPQVLAEMARGAIDSGDDDRAADVLRRAIELDSTDLGAHMLLLEVLDRLAGTGYDERVALDTDWRTNLAFEYYRVLDRAVRLAPDDHELRLWRGAAGIQMPFFVGKLDAGIADLEAVVAADVPDGTRAEAMRLLGVAYRRKGMEYWTRVVKEHPGTDAAGHALRDMRPPVEWLDEAEVERPAVVIDFVLAFRDELAPQTAVWVEDAAGAFVKTVYVSGFSGHAKGAQVNLPRWSKSSDYLGCDAVTGASINLGHHICTWDLVDVEGSRVPDGSYRVKVECSWWPSMKYELAELEVHVGRNEQRVSDDDGELVPYLGLRFLP